MAPQQSVNSVTLVRAMKKLGSRVAFTSVCNYLRMVFCGRVHYCGDSCRKRVRTGYEDLECDGCRLDASLAELSYGRLEPEERRALIEYVMNGH